LKFSEYVLGEKRNFRDKIVTAYMNFKFLAGLEDKSLGLVYREDYMFIVTDSSL
jgi:hypothetical protein